MGSPRDDIERALEEAKRAREEAERLRKDALQQAERLRNSAREDARRARDEARGLREQARRARHEERRLQREVHRHGPGTPGGDQPPGADALFQDDLPGAARAEQAFALEGVRHIEIDQTAGRLTIRACVGDETPGVVTSGNKSAPALDVQRDGDRLRIAIKVSAGWLFRRRQGVTTVVRLAGGFASVKVDAGYGDTEIRDVTAEDLKINVGAGNVSTHATRGTLDANVGAGKLSVHGHAGLARCDTGTGDILLDIAVLAEGDYKVDVGLGRAEVRLPEGGQVFVKASSGIGKSRIDYPSAGEGAPTRLKLNTGIGEVTVRIRNPNDAPPVRAMGTPRPQRGARGAQPIRRGEAEELRVLQMLEQGRITPQEAADLIAALQGTTPRLREEDAGDELAPEDV